MTWRVEVKVIGPHGYHLRTWIVQDDLLTIPFADQSQNIQMSKCARAFTQCYRDVHESELKEDTVQVLWSPDVWPDSDADGLRDIVRHHWPQLADALDMESGLS